MHIARLLAFTLALMTMPLWAGETGHDVVIQHRATEVPLGHNYAELFDHSLISVVAVVRIVSADTRPPTERPDGRVFTRYDSEIVELFKSTREQLEAGDRLSFRDHAGRVRLDGRWYTVKGVDTLLPGEQYLVFLVRNDNTEDYSAPLPGVVSIKHDKLSGRTPDAKEWCTPSTLTDFRAFARARSRGRP